MKEGAKVTQRSSRTYKGVGEFWKEVRRGIVYGFIAIAAVGAFVYMGNQSVAWRNQYLHDVLVAFRNPEAVTRHPEAVKRVAGLARHVLSRCKTDSTALAAVFRDFKGVGLGCVDEPLGEYQRAVTGHPSESFKHLMLVTGYTPDELYLALSHIQFAFIGEPENVSVLSENAGLIVRAYLGRITPAEIPSDAEPPFVASWFWLPAWILMSLFVFTRYFHITKESGTTSLAFPPKNPFGWATTAFLLPGLLLFIAGSWFCCLLITVGRGWEPQEQGASSS